MFNIEDFKMVRVTEEWLNENHPLLCSRATLLSDFLLSHAEVDLDLYYITGRYRGQEFWQTVFISPDIVDDPAYDQEAYQKQIALEWAEENYEDKGVSC